jgi:nitrite reductase/ring-hydroxylating ferredoxin subunit
MNAIPPKDDQLSRRTFLRRVVKGLLAGSALLGLGALVRYLGYQPDGSPREIFDLGPAEDYPLGTSRIYSPAQAVIVHAEHSIRALSLVCPHLGCVVNMTGAGFECPCHGSRFMPDGSLRNGPASRSLVTLRVEINSAGHLILYTG